MTQECEVGIIIKGMENPSTVRDFLKIQLNKDNFINKFDVYKDNNDVIVDLDIQNEVYFEKGCAATRWEPGEPAYIEGCIDEDYFRDWITDILDLKFRHEDYEIEFSEDTYIPSEENLLDAIYEEKFWREY